MLWTGFVFGLLSSLHCVGMCGALVLALPAPGGPAGWPYLRGRLLYHVGRLSTYAALGAVVGLLGRGLQVAGWQQGLSVASGGLMLGLVVVPERYRSRAAAALGLAGGLRWVQSQLAHYFRQPTARALYLTGVLNGLLPCGMVYVALAGALSCPGVGGAAGYMALFGVGTLPLLLALSLTGRLVPGAWRGRFRRALPMGAAGLAALFVLRGLGLGIPYLSPVLRAPATDIKASMHYCGAAPARP